MAHRISIPLWRAILAQDQRAITICHRRRLHSSSRRPKEYHSSSSSREHRLL